MFGDLPRPVVTPAAGPLRGQRGNVAVAVALSLVLLVGMFTLALDSGYLFTTQNRLRNAVEAAAMAAAAALCSEDMPGITAIVQDIVLANGLTLEDNHLTVETGFYDESDQYADFEVYRDFVAADNLPDNEFINAVCVTYTRRNIGLTGLNPGVSAAARAVAYLQRLDMAALDPHGDIRLGHDSIWERTHFFSNGSIRYPQSVAAGGKFYDPPAFNNCKLLAAGEVFKCSVRVVPFGFKKKIRVQWDTGVPQSGSAIHTDLDPLTAIRPLDDEALDYWRQRADSVYTPDQAGGDDVYYDRNSSFLDLGPVYCMDLAAESGVIFFDAGKDSDYSVLVSPYCGPPFTRTPNGYTITNLTFVATCSIKILNYQSTSTGSVNYDLHVGGRGVDQAVFISARDIEIYPSDSATIVFDGTVLRTGGDCIFGAAIPIFTNIRAVADGSIYGKHHEPFIGNSDPGLRLWNHSRFGPPCPPVLPRLGRLEAVDD